MLSRRAIVDAVAAVLTATGGTSANVYKQRLASPQKGELPWANVIAVDTPAEASKDRRGYKLTQKVAIALAVKGPEDWQPGKASGVVSGDVLLETLENEILGLLDGEVAVPAQIRAAGVVDWTFTGAQLVPNDQTDDGIWMSILSFEALTRFSK